MAAVLQLRREGPIGIIRIDEPPVNVLSVTVRQAIIDGFAAMRPDPSVEAIILLCGGRTFIAGFDITEFRGGLQEPALQAWKGLAANAQRSQEALLRRARLNGAACAGRYSATMEDDA